jgi:hypothetical protein
MPQHINPLPAKKRRSKESQQRFGNSNAKNKALHLRVQKWGLDKPKRKYVSLTPELISEVAGYFLDGCSDDDISVLMNIQEETIRAWRKLSCLKAAEQRRKLHFIHEIREGKRRDWVRLAWWLERRYPLEFSRPEVAHAIRTNITNTNNVTQNLVISSELAQQLAVRSEAIGHKLDQIFGKQSQSEPRELPAITSYNTDHIK